MLKASTQSPSSFILPSFSCLSLSSHSLSLILSLIQFMPFSSLTREGAACRTLPDNHPHHSFLHHLKSGPSFFRLLCLSTHSLFLFLIHSWLRTGEGHSEVQHVESFQIISIIIHPSIISLTVWRSNSIKAHVTQRRTRQKTVTIG